MQNIILVTDMMALIFNTLLNMNYFIFLYFCMADVIKLFFFTKYFIMYVKYQSMLFVMVPGGSYNQQTEGNPPSGESPTPDPMDGSEKSHSYSSGNDNTNADDNNYIYNTGTGHYSDNDNKGGYDYEDQDEASDGQYNSDTGSPSSDSYDSSYTNYDNSKWRR